jgi:hypothetical protein
MKQLLLTGFIQVFLVSANVIFISNKAWTYVFICGFFISLAWSFNVKKIAFGEWKDRIYYSLGAGIGALLGSLSANLFIQ